MSRFGLPRLWTSITSRSKFGSGQGSNQSYSSPRELSNSMSHTIIGRREEVDFRLLVVGSQTASLTPSPSFAHNLSCRCLNGQCEASWDIYTSDLFNDTKNTPMRGVLALQLELWIFGSPGGLQVPTFGSVGFTLTLSPKWGCDRLGLSIYEVMNKHKTQMKDIMDNKFKLSQDLFLSEQDIWNMACKLAKET